MTKNDIKYLLENRVYIEAEIKDLQYQIEELQSVESVGIAGISYAERVKSSSISNTTEQQALDNVGKEKMLRVDKIAKETQLKRLDKSMETLSVLEIKIITLKFIEHNKWAYIIRRLKAETNHASYIAERAIERLSRIMK